MLSVLQGRAVKSASDSSATLTLIPQPKDLPGIQRPIANRTELLPNAFGLFCHSAAATERVSAPIFGYNPTGCSLAPLEAPEENLSDDVEGNPAPDALRSDLAWQRTFLGRFKENLQLPPRKTRKSSCSAGKQPNARKQRAPVSSRERTCHKLI